MSKLYFKQPTRLARILRRIFSAPVKLNDAIQGIRVGNVSSKECEMSAN